MRGRGRESCSLGRRLFAAGLQILLQAEIVCSVQGAGEDVFRCGREADVSDAHAAPAAGDRNKEVGGFGEEGSLLIEGEHEVAVALCLSGEGSEDVAADAKIGHAHVGGLFGVGQGEGEAAEVGGGHRELTLV